MSNWNNRKEVRKDRETIKQRIAKGNLKNMH